MVLVGSVTLAASLGIFSMKLYREQPIGTVHVGLCVQCSTSTVFLLGYCSQLSLHLVSCD